MCVCDFPPLKMSGNYGAVGKYLVFLCCLLSSELSNFYTSGQQVNIECIPLTNCPIAMKLVSTKKYAPETIKFLRNSHCGSSKEFGPLIWCPNLNSCQTPDGKNGSCMDFLQCPSLLAKSVSTAELDKYRCNEYLENAYHVCCTIQFNRFNDGNYDPENIQDLNRESPNTEEMLSDQPTHSTNDQYSKKTHHDGPLKNRIYDDFVWKDIYHYWTAEDTYRPWTSPSRHNDYPNHGSGMDWNRDGTSSKVWPKTESSTFRNSDRSSWKPENSRTWPWTSHETTTTSNIGGVWSWEPEAPRGSPTPTHTLDGNQPSTTTVVQCNTTSRRTTEPASENPRRISTPSSISTTDNNDSIFKNSWKPDNSRTWPWKSQETTAGSNIGGVWSWEPEAPRRSPTPTTNDINQPRSTTFNNTPRTTTEPSYENPRRSSTPSYTSTTENTGSTFNNSDQNSWKPDDSWTWPWESHETTASSNMEGVWTWDPEVPGGSPTPTHTSDINQPSTTTSVQFNTTSRPIPEPSNENPRRSSTPRSTSTTDSSNSTILNIYEVDTFANISTICGRQTANSDKIIGGIAVDPGDYPWMALLEYSSNNGRRFGCGGTLINRRYVLTAAHCVDRRVLQSRRMQLYRVLLGEYDTRNVTDCIYTPSGANCADPPIYFGIESVFQHERFDNVNGVEDIALIRLNSDVTFTDYIKPICLPTGDFNIKLNDSLTVVGWGRTSSTDRPSPVLMKARLPHVPKSACDRYGSTALSSAQLCAGLGNGVDTCTGDSGGPMMVERVRDFELVAYQVGVVSYGYATGDGCGNAPSVNTYVPHYVDWIRRNVR
ncbi:unnamed protein product [Phaedon cochleariae]|uniref:Uncharacterized protein n=1 Tax=Phaedon cochleariae TaxID=80249 RepID=A0A9P0DLK3_PHACE|nr:unnamed protein product [Phaedon cochleariae]